MANENELENGTERDDAKFVLKFSHNIIEHLGLKLYQNKPTNVIAELVSNSWDADAKNVWVHLYTTEDGKPSGIVVADDGFGMSNDVLTKNYLVVGKPKRAKNAPAEKTPGGRLPMGRKGIGKLAPFGVARAVDMLTVQSGAATWLRFDYDSITEKSDQEQLLNEYEPDPLAINANIGVLIADGETPAAISEHLKKIQAESGSGTIIWAHRLTLIRAINPSIMLESLGRRFTVTLARPDFIVKVNDTHIQEAHVFPEWELRIPANSGTESVEVDTPIGIKTIKYWVGFVKAADWPSEKAGVGIYAHGKIAQDRPFFFGNKGNEIFTRYLYAVVEADWIDELEHDAISTDRTSIDWDNPAFEGLKKWGEEKIKEWLKAYQKLRKDNANKENTDIVEKVLNKNTNINIRTTEREHLVSLLSDITPKLGKESENTEKLVEATAKAWLHEPARRLIKQLWEDASQFEADTFVNVISRLSDQLIPESLSLAVVFSQRVYALTQLENHITFGKETQLQTLIESFPWILNNSYEKFFPRKSLETMCKKAVEGGYTIDRNVHASKGDTFPDFVFLGDSDDKNILVVELKGNEITASWEEDEQLDSYKRFLQSKFTNTKVRGILVAGGFEENVKEQGSKTTDYQKWDDILLRSRRDHMKLLAALLAGADADPNDSRVKQICELGGKPVQDFLIAMSNTAPELKHIVEKLSQSKTS